MDNATKSRLYYYFRFIPDTFFLKVFFLFKTKHFLHLTKPRSFNEKIQWRKVYDRKELYVKLVDKLAVREYVSKIVGDKYLIPLIGHWENVDDIPFQDMPSKFVLKCNHDSGSVIICEDINSFDTERAKTILKRNLKTNYFWRGREWAYKEVKPCVVAEQFIEEQHHDLRDYKFFCFGGKVSFVQVDIDRHSNHCRNLYSRDWQLLDLQIEYPTAPSVVIEKPNNYEEMLNVAELLARNLGHARVDLYNINGKVLFGEITLYHGSGVEKIIPREFDFKLGELYEVECE